MHSRAIANPAKNQGKPLDNLLVSPIHPIPIFPREQKLCRKRLVTLQS